MPLPTSFFVSDTVHERKVKLGNEEEHTLHFRELSHTDFRKFFDDERSEDEDVRAAAVARMIALSLCTPDGKPALTAKDAIRLKPSVANAIADQVLDVNGMKKGNASPPGANNGSGTS